METKKLASAYADAVLDYLETGIAQGIVYKDDLYLLAGRGDCESTPHLWVDRHWRKFVPGLTVPVDPLDPAFNAVRLRAQIIERLVASKKDLRLSVGLNRPIIRAKPKQKPPATTPQIDSADAVFQPRPVADVPQEPAG